MQMKMINLSLKYVSLLTLCLQNSTLVIVMRYSRLDQDKDALYFTSTAVFLSELSKLIISIYMAIRNQIKTKGHFDPRELYNEVFAEDAWKLAIPAILYTIQNNLQYIAVSLLDAATFQVTYQLKILTTALCSVVMLKTSLSSVKWFSLGLLTFGVALVQLRTNSVVGSAAGENDETLIVDEELSREEEQIVIERILGLIAVAIACIISGIAGVYFEKVLKGSKTSIWTRNIQLSFFSLFPALIIGVWWKDGEGVWEKGFFYGYNMTVVSAIACQAVGGLIVAMVVKYADNILKGFATSISIIISFLASVVLFDFVVTFKFLAGATFVLIATCMYSQPEKQKQNLPIVNESQTLSLLSSSSSSSSPSSSSPPSSSSSPKSNNTFSNSNSHHNHNSPSLSSITTLLSPTISSPPFFNSDNIGYNVKTII